MAKIMEGGSQVSATVEPRINNQRTYRAKARRSRRADRPDHDPAQEDRALHREREGPSGAHHQVRREPVGGAG